MNDYNEKLPWILILGGCAILVLRLIVALFSSLSVIDWLAIITVSYTHLTLPTNREV